MAAYWTVFGRFGPLHFARWVFWQTLFASRFLAMVGILCDRIWNRPTRHALAMPVWHVNQCLRIYQCCLAPKWHSGWRSVSGGHCAVSIKCLITDFIKRAANVQKRGANFRVRKRIHAKLQGKQKAVHNVQHIVWHRGTSWRESLLNKISQEMPTGTLMCRLQRKRSFSFATVCLPRTLDI